jgi:ribosomal protein S18 acetylase RimI-like enzyme
VDPAAPVIPVLPHALPVRVRAAVAEDAPALHALIREAMRLYAEASDIPGTLESLMESVADVLRHVREDDVLVAEYGHEGAYSLVGTLRLSTADEPDVAYLSRFAVDPDVQRIGVGGALMHAVDAYATARGLRTVRLHTALANVPLIRFYRARGFAVMDAEVSRGYPRARLEKRYGKGASPKRNRKA